MPDWIWQNLTSAVLWEFLLLIGVGVLLERLKAKWPTVAHRILYALGGVTCVAVIFFTFTGRALLSKPIQTVTADNAEENIRKWADDIGMGVTKLPEQSDIYFALSISLPSGNSISVYRGKVKSSFLQIQCSLALSPDHLAMLSKLTKEQADDAVEEITLELNKMRVGYVMQTAASLAIPGPGGQSTTRPNILQQTILVSKPIAMSELTQSSFTSRMDELDSEIGIVRGITDVTLKRYTRAAAITPRIVSQ